MTDVITITFGDVGEAHVGMEKVGVLSDQGISITELKKIKRKLDKKGANCEYHCLNELIPNEEVEEAGILIIRGGLEFLMGEEINRKMMRILKKLEWDKHALMRGKVKNKIARWNLVFSDYSCEPNYENKKGRVIDFEEIKVLKRCRRRIGQLSDELKNLQAEGNWYYDVKKCYIGFHGDAERRKVIAIRLGSTFPLYYQWYKDCQRVGNMFKIDLNHGDIYIMSDKAVGNDWKRRLVFTLRHAAGFKIK